MKYVFSPALRTVAMPALLALAFASAGAHAELMNGDFSDGLNSWTTAGDVAVEMEAAVLGDADPDSALLFQGANLGPGVHTLEFDFLNELSAFEPMGGFPDIAAVSIYLIDDLGAFDLDTLTFDDAIALATFDHDSEVIANGSISPSSLGGDWLHYTVSFSSPYQYAIPVFELFSLNGERADSQFRIDNVVFTTTGVIPEPATLTLFASGLALFAARRRKFGSESARSTSKGRNQ